MRLGGIQKASLIDFPGKLCCVLFLSGCNFTCPYCHNPDLARGSAVCPDYLTEAWFFDFLEDRKGFLEGVVISGGEPTLQADLPQLCKRIKAKGYAVKIDTNGSRSEVLRQLIQECLVDFIAMDIKTDPDRYAPVFSTPAEAQAVLTSIGIVMGSSIDYEFRTTCVKPLVDRQVIERISTLIRGCKRYALQPFHHGRILCPEFAQKADPAYSSEELLALKAVAEPRVDECIVRGAT